MNLPFFGDEPVWWLARCAEIFGRAQPLSPDSVEAYFQAVGCDDPEKLVAAFKAAVRHGEGFPVPHDIRGYIAQAEQGSGSDAYRAAVAAGLGFPGTHNSDKGNGGA